MGIRTIETVWVVSVEGRMDGIYLFRLLSDAERFVLAVERNGGSATCTETPICHAAETTALIEAENG